MINLPDIIYYKYSLDLRGVPKEGRKLNLSKDDLEELSSLITIPPYKVFGFELNVQ